MANVTFNLTKITVLQGAGTDQINLSVLGPTPYPELAKAHPEENYGITLSVQTRKGYALEWLKQMELDILGIPVQVIGTTGHTDHSSTNIRSN